ncbi:PAS domain S-box-containing protein [Azospirillum lipoferum]|uniref:PAS domain S-box protein n=1 Tax=Azospirillum lipoferum TaxID=193 RepID=A0A5A9G1I8_AZOLI|nr:MULTISPECIES: sigma 54-interacting transcriptional regulator [Azospirillum]KAA0588430.1 PAS domain S-box protein [Azospirillum lipoferum]MCP1615255.1 PAS domain S-box-containing protein [Azospirillum lipoferum]MDW5534054.1 sigma 54-interacting transcriptional regulator [Azospirillum sp. NL1]
MDGFGLAFEHGLDACLVVDPADGRILDANQAACRLLGYGRGVLRATLFPDLHRGQEPALIVFTEAVLAQGVHWSRALSPRHGTGTDLRLEYAGSRLPQTGSDGPAILLTLHDLDERRRRDVDCEADGYMQGGIGAWRRVERVFQDIERENQLILQAAGEGIYGVNADGKTSFVNPAAERILGWPAAEMLGRDMHAIVHHHRHDGSAYPNHQCPIYAAFRDGEVHRVSDEVFWHRDGRPIWVEYTSTPIRAGGAVVGAVVVFRDVSQRREAEENLRAALAEVDRLRQRLELENAYLQEEIRQTGNHHGVIGRSAAIQHILRQVELVAPTDANVLVTGESGTGKELIARAIHEASRRNTRPLIRVNCAAIPRELFESEFFGHARGAFTGALRDRVGRFELADGGTLFLDEVGEIPLDQQGKLLRVLQEGQLERVGETRTREVNVRVVAATNRDLRAEVERGRFREDLYFRLNVFPIESPPLRDRPEDIPLLATHFLRAASRKLNTGPVTLTEGNVRQLSAYRWPGNVRELQNVIERAAILASQGRITLDLPAGALPVRGSAKAVAPPATAVETEADRRARDRANILAALDAAGGKVSGPGGAAERLGLRPTTLASRMKALGIASRR